MAETDVDWDAILSSERFRRLAQKRRNTAVVLGVLAAIYYFSIPALIAWAPSFFKIRLIPGINLGTIFAVSQYPFGGAIAYAFLRRTAQIDQATSDVKEQAAPIPAAGEQRHAY
ncbi:uncharacterized membrane protein (DUF485 family) [Paraburkholderia sp. BL6665CI2N2]|uniref:DUF485 domain-containing protein n=1 Tax=Paraburkholderia sp. BL6665CI2N2 TaxID=1938806 RepID=UPI001064F34B|nr:DUF485 domain-containing protein [Paraburkholderia sp. BL6665CI2N2]TDY22023.1 uncharacterized membrane protein (DUF485 family) [Paraburkholderia sp. BL6665CI2N2]